MVMDVDDPDHRDVAAMWIFGAVLTAAVLFVLIFWPEETARWPALVLAATLPLYHVWKVRATLRWLEEEYGVQWEWERQDGEA